MQIHSIILFFFGFSMLFNVLIGSQRLMIFVYIFLLLFYVTLDSRNIMKFMVSAMILLLVFVLRVFFSDYDNQTIFMLTSLALASLSGFILVKFMDDEDSTRAFANGMMMGATFVVAIFVLQILGYSEMLRSIGVIPSISANLINFDGSISQVYNEYTTGDGLRSRFSGMWEHPNSAAHAFLIAIPAFIYSFMKEKKIRYILYSMVMVSIVFYATYTRALLVVYISLLASIALKIDDKKTRVMYLISMSLLFVGFLTIVASGLLVDRLEIDVATDDNFTNRMVSGLAGLGVSLDNPFGVAFHAIRPIILNSTGVGAVHNGYLFFALVFGLPLFLIMIFGGYLVIRNRSNDLLFFIFLQLTISAMFEELPHNSSFISVFGLFLGVVIVLIERTLFAKPKALAGS